MGEEWDDSGTGSEAAWTTRDEVNYLKELAERGGAKLLLNYQRSFKYRRFDGEGMEVDRMEVAKALHGMLFRMATIKQIAKNRGNGVRNDEAHIARTAKAWLGGGALRRMASRRKGDDDADAR